MELAMEAQEIIRQSAEPEKLNRLSNKPVRD